jgi:hypothetical protein
MRPIAPILTAVAAALAACSNTGDGHAANSRICTPFPEQAANANGRTGAAAPAPTDPASAVDDCLHRWGYTLAASSDPAEQVAQATVAACVSLLTRWNQQAASAGAPTTAPSLVTGEDATPLSEHYAYARGRALFYVVQARAGKCAAPAPQPPAKG